MKSFSIAEIVSYDKSGFDGAKTLPAVCRDISLKQTGTQYCYRAGTDGAWGQVYTFTTDDPQSEVVTFA